MAQFQEYYRAYPRVRAGRMTVIDSTVTLQVSDYDKVLEAAGAANQL
jgi:hypothetical protein